MEETTIAAISTAMSASGIGIVRISGPEAFEIASGVYRSKGGKKSLKNVPSHTIHYGYIYDNEEMVDEVLVMAMRGPRTYTGEDTIEIDCHGGVLAMKKVLETVLKKKKTEPLLPSRENLPSVHSSMEGSIFHRLRPLWT